ncbi:NUDIX domain-containing protein [Leeia oryzae]|uniref:NUDIX domain-containing protein n=1 Tax=Leeia oryzae TaxID=356662 RepID=UPI00036B457B|nr:NUDIX domain-containing protein [Leeia oryzae]
MTKRFVHVAAGVLLQPDGRFLLASRPEGKPMAGYWEFPGGKIEAGETPFHALVRELHEELGIVVKSAYPWLVQSFDYTHARVKLHFFQICDWEGELHSKEQQLFAWQTIGAVDVAPVLPANTGILRWLALAPRLTLSQEDADAGESSLPVFPQQDRPWKGLQVHDLNDFKAAVQSGLDYLVWMPATLPEEDGQSALLEHAILPVYVPEQSVGGDVNRARQLGAHGIWSFGDK